MFEILCCDLVFGSVGVVLVFGVKGLVVFIDVVYVQCVVDSLKYKVGDIEVFSLYEGVVECFVIESMVKNVGFDDVKKVLVVFGFGLDKIDNFFMVIVIWIGGKVILFDIGFGGNGLVSVGKFVGNMKVVGFDLVIVLMVVILYFYFDYILGFWVKEIDVQVFLNVEIMMFEVEYKFWIDVLFVEKVFEVNCLYVKCIQVIFLIWKNIK